MNSIVPDLPQPIFSLEMPAGAQNVMTVLWIIFAAAAFIFCVWLSIRQKSWLPIVVEIGAASALFGEALIIHLMNCWYPAVGQNVLFKAVGQSIPTFVPFAYLFYFAPWILLMIGAFEKGVTKKTFWLFYGLCFVGVTGYEIIGTVFGFHLYYGNLPLYLFDLIPTVFSFLNPLLIIIPAVLIYLVKEHLTGWKMLLVIPLMGGIVAIDIWVGMPFFSAINTPETPEFLRVFCAVYAIACALGLTAFLAGIVSSKKRLTISE